MTVMEKDTAQAVGSGDLPVFATPSLAALVEKTAVESVKPYLEKENTTVGFSLDLKHLAPTPVGNQVACESELIAADGRKLTFHAVISDQKQKIGECIHIRVIVNRDKFMQKC